MKLGEMFPSRYLKGSDLAGRATTVEIVDVVLETFYDPHQKADVKKPVLYFRDKTKGVVMGKTLAYAIAAILNSEDCDTWIGKKIVIFSERKQLFGVEKEIISARASGDAT